MRMSNRRVDLSMVDVGMVASLTVVKRRICHGVHGVY
jgi:hypothetical protein